MRFDTTVELGAATMTVDSIGQEVESLTWRTVYANEFRLTSGEFYAAGQQGLKAEREYQIRACDYADEARARVGAVAYDVIRVERRGEWTRLTLGHKVAS